MMQRMKNLLMLLFVGLLPATIFAQNKLDPAWDAFNENKREEARKLFLEAKQTDASNADIHFGLMFLDLSESNEESAMKHFREGIKHVDNPEAYLYSMWMTPVVTDGYGKKDATRLKWLKDIAKNEAYSPSMRSIAQYVLARHYEVKGNFKESRQAAAQIKDILDWQITGSFDNTSGSGFDKKHEPIEHSESDYQFTNEYKAKVNWIPSSNHQAGDWLDFNYYFYTDDALCFAQTFVQSPEEQEVIIGVATSGSTKMWVNDALVLSESQEFALQIDGYPVKLKLNKGWNRILLQVGEAERSSSSLLVRLMDTNFNVLEGLTYSASAQDYTPTPSLQAELLRIPAEIYFEEKIAKEPNNLVPHLFLFFTYQHNSKNELMRSVMNKMREKAPNSAYLVLQDMYLLIREENRTKLTKLVEWIKEEDKENLVALDLLYDQAMDNEDYQEAEAMLAKIEMLYGKTEDTYQKRIRLMAARENYEPMVALANEGWKRFPESTYFLDLQYKIKKQIQRDPRGATLLLERYIDKTYDTDIVVALANEYIEQGQLERGLKMYREILKNFPNSVGHMESIADIYFSSQRYDKALEYNQKVLDQAPYIAKFHRSEGAIHEQMGNKTKAIAAFEKSLYYNPNNFDDRAKIRELKGQKDVYDYFEEIDPYQLFADAPDADAFPDDNSYLIYDDVQRVVYEKGATEQRYIMVAKVFNTTGVEDWKEMNLYSSYSDRLSIEKAEVLKADGTRVSAERSGSRIVFTNLEPGDGIYLNYKRESFKYGKLLGHFWDDYSFNYFIPTKTTKYQILAPKGFAFNYKALNTDTKPTITEQGDFQLYIWEENDNPSIRYETLMPPMSDIAHQLHVSTIPDWNFIAEWYADLVTSKIKKDAEVERALAEIFPKGAEGMTETQRAEAIYRYIVENITYSSVSFRQSAYVPQRAAKTLRTQLGDCKDVSTLFVTMAEEVDLDAQLLLVSTRENGEDIMPLPSILFNHCIVKVDADDKDYFLELTSKQNPFASASPNLDGAPVLRIPKGGKTVTDAAIEALQCEHRTGNDKVRKSVVKVNGKNLEVDVISEKTGVLSAGMRNTYRDQSRDQQEKSMTQAIGSDNTNPVKLRTLEFVEGLDEPTNSINYKYGYTVSNELVSINNMSLFKLPWADALGSLDFVSEEERNYPFLFWQFSYTDSAEETMEINIPEGKTLVEMPANKSFSFGDFSYDLKFQQEGGKLIATRKTNYAMQRISKEDYPKLKTFFEQVAEADGQFIGFK